MTIRNFILLLSIALFCYNCKTLQFEGPTNVKADNSGLEEMGFEPEPGKCYAKCYIGQSYKIYSDAYPIYTGDETEEEVDVETIEIELRPKATKWVKKKADRQCLSPDPNDCLVWCLVDVPAVTKQIKILRDTTQSENFEMQKISHEELNQEGGVTEWKEVLCENKITRLVIAQVQNALRDNGFYDNENSFEMDSKTKSALTQFQKENKLPIGNLDFETLDVLGIVAD